MKNLIAGLLLVWAVPLPAQVRSGEAVIDVNAAKPAGYKIPRTIFGTFLEPIGHSIYGGVWAQILENPSFEANDWSLHDLEEMLRRHPELRESSGIGLPAPWQPLHAQQGWRYEPRWGDAANSQRSLLLMALPSGETGVRQEVYLPVHRCLRYSGSLYARPVSGPAEINISLRRRDHPEDVLAHASIRTGGEGWTKHEFALTLPAGKLDRLEPADFAIAVSNDARILVDQVFLFPADNIDGLDPDMVAMSRDLKTPVVRYGGNFTSGYHWRDGVGPVDKRVSMLNQSWGMPEYNHFGTDEFLRFCQLIHAEPQIALNLGTGTPQEAADWVRYVNGKWGDHSGGLLWELGNELWGNWQIGYPTLEQVAERTRRFSDAVRAADPRARLIATGQDPDAFEKWNAAQLTIAPDAYSYLSTHFVVGVEVRQPNPSPQFVAQASLALPVGLERRLRMMREQIEANPRSRGKVRIAFTEWLFHSNENLLPSFQNMGGALCAAGFLNALIRVADFTPISDMTGLIEFGGIWQKRGQVYGVPAYWAFRLYSNADIAIPVETRTQVETYDVHQGNRRIPEIPGVPYLDVVSALNESRDKLTLLCVNRKMDGAITAQIRISDFPAAQQARVQQLAPGSISAANDEAHPDNVRPKETTLTVGSGNLEYAFPPNSVTVIELHRR